MAQPVSLSLTGVGVSPWKNLNWREPAFHVQFNCTVSGTATYSIETTISDYLAGVTAIVAPTTIASATTSQYLTSTAPARAWRLNVTAISGTVTVEAVQSGY